MSWFGPMAPSSGNSSIGQTAGSKSSSFGAYPETGLKKARVRRDEARGEIGRGGDPTGRRRRAKIEAAIRARYVREGRSRVCREVRSGRAMGKRTEPIGRRDRPCSRAVSCPSTSSDCAVVKMTARPWGLRWADGLISHDGEARLTAETLRASCSPEIAPLRRSSRAAGEPHSLLSSGSAAARSAPNER